MRRILLAAILTMLPLAAVCQYRDSENLRERLKWDDEKLHIMLDTRFDLRYDNIAGEDNVGFKGQSLRLWLEGEIIPGIRYRLRHRLNKSQAPLSDGLADATDHAWVAFDIGRSKQWTITVGKQLVQLGTYEYEYNPADNYVSTAVNADFDSHQIGLNTAYRFLGQTVNLQVFNAGSGQFATEDYRKKALGGSMLWQGSFFSGILNTRTGYTVLQHSADRFYGWFSTGWQIRAGGFTAEADYYAGDRDMDYSGTVGEAGIHPVRDRYVALGIKYGTGKWRPFIKGVYDNRYDRGQKNEVYDNFGIQAALEYYPFTGHKYVADLRFHVAYGYTYTSFNKTLNNVPDKAQHMLLLGVRWFFTAK